MVVEEKDSNRLMGEVIPFDYGESVQRIQKAALPYVYISGEFGDGTTFSKMLYTEYASDEFLRVRVQHGGLKRCELYPESEDELKLRIAQEHRIQTGKKKSTIEKRKCVSR